MLHQFKNRDFLHQLRTAWLGHHFWYYESLESTNAFLGQKVADDTPHGLICLTDHQTAGKGQHNRQWVSNPAANLTFTAVFKPVENQTLNTLGLACAYSVAELVSALVTAPVQLKWPNDIYAGEYKIGGILTESSYAGSKVERVLVGVGVNVSKQEFKEGLSDNAGSIGYLSDGKTIPARERLLAELLSGMEATYQRWEAGQDEFLRQINRTLYGYGRWVYLREGEKVLDHKYKLLGVNRDGGLCVLNEELDVKVFRHEQVRVHEFAEEV